MTVKKQGTKIIVSIVAFFLVFGILLTIATFYDLDIDHFLTRESLAEHNYYTNDLFAASFETFGCSPLNFMVAFALHILFWYAMYYQKGFMKIALYLFSLGGSFTSFYILGSDTLDYCRRHLALTSDLEVAPMFYIVFGFFAILLTGVGIAAVHNFSKETIKKLMPFAVATLFLCAVPTLTINLLVKNQVGRIRYRAMNMYPDNQQYGFAAYQRWYEAKGQWLDHDTKVALFGTSDALRSFPSGHTCDAGLTYGLAMLNDALDIKKKKLRAFLWIGPLVFTGLVAVSRMVAGAHFMSDVLVGGTAAFASMIILREIFILKGKNVKILLGKTTDA